MKTATLLTAVAVLLTASLSFADGWGEERFERHEDRFEHRHHHRRPEMPAFRAGGHYEWRVVSQWVEARYDQVYVPPRCTLMYGVRNVCTAPTYRQVYRPGHYENVEQWVWVADFYRPRYERRQYGYAMPPAPVPPRVQGRHGAVPVNDWQHHQHRR